MFRRMLVFYMALILSSSTALLVQRNMKMKIQSNSYYQLGYFGNFIQNITAKSMMRCGLACQNNDQCRLANYNSQSFICSLIDESSFVGQILASTSEKSVIILQLCEDPTKQEPTYVCFGSVRPSVTLQYAITNSQLKTTISEKLYIARFSPTGLLYAQLHASDTMYVYELENYKQIQTLEIFSGQNMRNFDADFAQNYFVYTGYDSGARNLYVMSPTGNRIISGTQDYWGVCLSDRYIIVSRKASGSTLDVYERSDGSLAFRISASSDYNGCGVIRDQLFMLTDSSGLKSTNLVNRTGATMTNWPYGSCRQGFTSMVIDSSGRTYIACANSGLFGLTCTGYSMCSVVSSELGNTQLTTLNDYYYISGRASKYNYRYTASDTNANKLYIYEY